MNNNFRTCCKTNILACIHTYSKYIPLNNHIRPVMYINNFLTDGTIEGISVGISVGVDVGALVSLIVGGLVGLLEGPVGRLEGTF